MRRYRLHIVAFCLLALVWCQVAMAAMWCHGGSSNEATIASCHGGDQIAADTDAQSCPAGDIVPDLGKLPSLPTAMAGHDFDFAIPVHRVSVAIAHRLAPVRAGPALDRLCRLLI